MANSNDFNVRDSKSFQNIYRTLLNYLRCGRCALEGWRSGHFCGEGTAAFFIYFFFWNRKKLYLDASLRASHLKIIVVCIQRDNRTYYEKIHCGKFLTLRRCTCAFSEMVMLG